MPGIVQVTQVGPKSFKPAATQKIFGGQLVELTDAGRIQPAAAASIRAVGVALTDGIAPEDVNTDVTLDAMSRPVLTAAPVPTVVAVAYGGTEVNVKALAAVKPGQRVKAAANGQVTVATAGDPADQIVGVCTDPNGIAAGKTGLVRITL